MTTDTLKQAARKLALRATDYDYVGDRAGADECRALAAALEAMADCPQDHPKSERQAALSRTGDGQDRAEHDAQARDAARYGALRAFHHSMTPERALILDLNIYEPKVMGNQSLKQLDHLDAAIDAIIKTTGGAA